MKTPNLMILLAMLFCCTNIALHAQPLGQSTASLAMNRAIGVTSPDEVVLEDYLNYHEHHIPLPKKGEQVALSVDLDYLDQEKLLIQVGLTSTRFLDYSKMPPINICLVIDKSGSMADDGKLEKVKRALLRFTEGLRPDDIISIVAYDSDASIILSAQKARDKSRISLAINGLMNSGSTNLNAGLVLGYEEVLKNYDARCTNRVILLTDGIANKGVISSEKIISKSKSYNKKGISVSTIGVGNDINFSLLQQISRAGKGHNHFIGSSAEDIQKVFDDELQSLLSSIAKDVTITIELPNGVEVEKIFGYSPQFKGNVISIPINDINSGLTQIVLLEARVIGKEKPLKTIKAEISYYSPSTESRESLQASRQFDALSLLEQEFVLNNELQKNYTIAEMAEALKRMATEVVHENYSTSLNILEVALSKVKREFPLLRDKDIIRVRDILKMNYETLKRNIKMYETRKIE